MQLQSRKFLKTADILKKNITFYLSFISVLLNKASFSILFEHTSYVEKN